MTTPQYSELRRDIIAAVANDYYENLKNEAPYINMKFEEIGAVCRDLATNDVDELLDSIVPVTKTDTSAEDLRSGDFVRGQDQLVKGYNQAISDIKANISKYKGQGE